MALDVKLFFLLNNLIGHSRVFDMLVVFLAEYLQYVLILLFLLLLIFSSGYTKRGKLRIFLVTSLSIVVARLGITEIIRFFYHRPRPFSTLHVHKLLSSGWFYSDKEWSFPSGHSAFFFAMATAIYLYNKKWGLGFFIAAIVMNISRIIVGVHYPSDIVGGMIVGMLTAYIIFYVAEKRKAK